MYFDLTKFGKRIQYLRKAANITQQEFARDLNIDKQHVSRIERGKHFCSIDLLIEIAVYFNVSTDFLLTGKQPESSSKKEETIEEILLAVEKELRCILK